MNLREKVAEAMWDTVGPADGEMAGPTKWASMTPLHIAFDMMATYRAEADAAISAVFEALLSDAAVEAGAEAIAEMCRPMFDFRPGGHGPSSWMPWDDTPVIEGNAKARTITREQFKAAQSALTADAAQTGGELDGDDQEAQQS